MGNEKRKWNYRSKWDAAAFRKKCIRLIAYICVFFIVLNRRLSAEKKKRLSISFCGCVVALVIVVSLAGQGKTETAGKEMPVVKILSGGHNRVTGGQMKATIEMNRSRVIVDQEGVADAVSAPENPGAADADRNVVQETGGRNRVAVTGRKEQTSGEKPDQNADETEELSPVQALLENNGEDRKNEAVERQYQYPLEIGRDGKQGGGSMQSTADFIKKKVYEVVADGGAVSPGAVSPAGIQAEETPVPGLPKKDGEKGEETPVPAIAFDESSCIKLEGRDKVIFCTNDNDIKTSVVTSEVETGEIGIEKICYAYSDKLRYCLNPSAGTALRVPENFYGQVVANCFDTAGAKSDSVSGCFLVENQAPEIRFSEDTFCTAPYTLWVDIGETGEIVSGIRDVKCTVNGQPYEIKNLSTLQNTVLDEGLEVPAKCEFSVPFTEEGQYTVAVTVTDNASNVSTEEKVVRVTKPELISVFMPEKFSIHIDPQQLAGREQIYSDDIMLKNDSEFDVQVVVKKVEVSIKDEVSDTGIKKDCNLYMIAPDTGEKIPLKKGENKEVYSYCLNKGEKGDAGKLKFAGDTTEGSDAMWKDSDVVIRVELEFLKKEGGQS